MLSIAETAIGNTAAQEFRLGLDFRVRFSVGCYLVIYFTFNRWHFIEHWHTMITIARTCK